MPRFPDHLKGHGPQNPFPGIKVLERRLGREIPYRLGSNEGLDMPHAALRAHFGDAMVEHAYCYGDSEALGVRQRVSAQLGTPLDSLLVDAGADSLLALVVRTVTTPGCTVVESRGTYPTFGYFAESHGCERIEVEYNEGPGRLAPDLEALITAAHETEARVVYLANPDNPTGHVHDDDAVLDLRARLPEECWLLLDEAYHDFRQDADSPFAAEVLPGVIRLRTLSKAHGMAGMRIGYAIAEPQTIEMMMKARIHYAVSTLTLAAAEVVLDHPEETRQHIQAVHARRERLAEHLGSLGADVLPSGTNFIALRMPSSELAASIHADLLDAGSLINRPPSPNLGHILRITAVEEALKPGRLAALEAALAECS
ncbi:pyridoxal phosphate-dependent aminotransferase [Litchfieldella xinjiangensis]|uniref:pyridoxal phosphate-dependent aminotransferase n=1 Tax=Litchfieldella xinjiangensis TaxID=1166948 RepID=UPI0005B7CB20|nr:aminotransferase class I/II-fold pyridoxal phosphate-dependent enzyme [Halomonas xinjiangensis]